MAEGRCGRGGPEISDVRNHTYVLLPMCAPVLTHILCREWKVMACRACLKVGLLGLLLLVYLVLWFVCDACIVWFTLLCCGVSVLGAPFVTPACAVGVACSLLKGVHLGSGPLHMDVKWDGRR